MPDISVVLIEGCSADVRRRLRARLAEAAREVLPDSAGEAAVTIREIAPAGRRRLPPGAARDSAAQVALDFLAAQAARDAEAAAALCADGFEMVFPGGVAMRSLEELAAWGAARYRRIAKRIARVEESPLGDVVAVHVDGTLEGERLDGAPFSGVRFIDRFEIAGGRVLRQEVWNDLAEAFFAPRA